MTRTQQEIIVQGYKALVDSLGIVDAIKFVQYYSPGKGDYTRERHQWLDKKSLDDVFTQIKQFQDDDTEQYEEIIK